jgi:hypothetical protein
MGEQKNLFLAIGLSIVIIVAFQFLFPQKSINVPAASNQAEQIQPAASIDNNQAISNQSIKSKEEASTLLKELS